MWKWLRVIVVVVCILLFWCCPVLADNSADVTITASGFIVATPSGLILTYINPNQVQIDWTKGASANNTMVRGAVGREPTSRTDGYLVYYGTGTSANDTGVSFEETAAPIYYRAWSQADGGLWESTGISGFIEGGGMTLIALFLLALVLSAFVIWGKTPNLVITTMATGAWAVIWWYSINNPMTGMAIGSIGNQFLVMVCVVGLIGMPLTYFMRTGNDRKQSRQNQYKERIQSGDLSEAETVSRGRTNDMGDLSASEYKTYIHSKLHRPNRRT